MPQRHVQSDEWWPVLVLDDGPSFHGEDPIDFTEAELADLKRVAAEWEAWQNRIAERFGIAVGCYDPRIDQVD